MLAAVTGWDVTADELRTTSERIVTAKKLYNLREGWTRAEDTLPPRFLEESLGGAASLRRADLDRMIRAYYRARTWTEDGDVPPSVLARLGLEGAGGGHPPARAVDSGA